MKNFQIKQSFFLVAGLLSSACVLAAPGGEGDPKFAAFCDGFGEGYNAVLDERFGEEREATVPECPTKLYKPTNIHDIDFEEGIMLGSDMASKTLK